MSENEYIVWPEPGLSPGPGLRVGYKETANGANVVHSPKGHEWTKVPEGDQSADLIRLRQAITGAAKFDLSQLTGFAPDGTTDAVATRIWSDIVRSRAAEFEKVTANMIDVATLRVSDANITGLDAGRITTGTLDSARIAAGSITAAKLQAGTITANSGVIDSLDADKITTGRIKSALITTETLMGKELRGGIVVSGKDDANEVRLGDGTLQAKSGGKVTGRLSPQNGLEVVNPRTGTLQAVNPLVFGTMSLSRSFQTPLSIPRPPANKVKGPEKMVVLGREMAPSDRYLVIASGFTNSGGPNVLVAPVDLRLEVWDTANNSRRFFKVMGAYSWLPDMHMGIPMGLTPGRTYEFRLIFNTRGSTVVAYNTDTQFNDLNVIARPI